MGESEREREREREREKSKGCTTDEEDICYVLPSPVMVAKQ